MRIRTSTVLALKAIVGLTLALAIFSTCSKKSIITNPHDRTSPLLLKIHLINNSLVDFIDRVHLAVANDSDTIRTDLTLQNGHISGSVEVPVGRNNLTVEALDASSRVIYRGDTTLTVVGGLTTKLSISLTPEVFLLKLSPVYQEVDNLQSFYVKIKLYNVEEFADDLFGISFRVEFDPERLYCTRADSGGFLGPPDPTFFYSKIDTSEGYVAVGYTKIHGSTHTVPDNGTLAVIDFKARQSEALVDLILNRETLTLYDSEGERVDWKENLYVHNGQVLIR